MHEEIKSEHDLKDAFYKLRWHSYEDFVDALHACSAHVAPICPTGALGASCAEAVATGMSPRGNPLRHADWASLSRSIREHRFHHALLLAQGCVYLNLLSLHLGELRFHSLSFGSFLNSRATRAVEFVEDLLLRFVVLQCACGNRPSPVCVAETPKTGTLLPVVVCCLLTDHSSPHCDCQITSRESFRERHMTVC